MRIVKDVACYCYEEAGCYQIAGCQNPCEEGNGSEADTSEPISIQAASTSCCSEKEER
jgi:hypothetical protein